jgi:Uncharacterized protein conserved in bacteria
VYAYFLFSRNPEAVQYAYTPDSIWRNRDVFLQGREEIVQFLRQKWAKEQEYRLRKELFAVTDNKVCPIGSYFIPLLGQVEQLRSLSTLSDDHFRLQSNFGTNGTMSLVNGGVHMGWRIGLLLRMD